MILGEPGDAELEAVHGTWVLHGELDWWVGKISQGMEGATKTCVDARPCQTYNKVLFAEYSKSDRMSLLR